MCNFTLHRVPYDIKLLSMKKLFTFIAFILGCVALYAQSDPVEMMISSEEVFNNDWTNLHLGSGNAFVYGDACALYNEDKTNAANEWMISPAVQLEEGKTYTIEVSVMMSSTFGSDKHSFKVYVGKDKTKEAQNTEVYSDNAFSSKLFDWHGADFKCTESGTYYVGLNLISRSYQGDFKYQGVRITEKYIAPEKPLTLPYQNAFDDDTSDDKFTFLTDGTKDWKYSSSKKCMEYWGGTSPVDVWFVLPKLPFEAGKTYRIGFSAGLENAAREDHYKDLYVKLGNEPTTASLTQEIFHENIQSALMEGKEAFFSVPETGEYSIGFGCCGATSTYSLFVDDIVIEESVAKPAAVEGLAVAADPTGLLKATVSWTNPTKTNAGTALAKIDKVEVYRGEDLIKTYTEAAVGEEMQYVDEAVAEKGKYDYSVVAYLDSNAGDKATVASPWIGTDTPKAVADAAAALDGEYIKISFTAPSEGVNGGYINAADLVYTITRLSDNAVLTSDLKATEYIDTEDLPLGKYSYSIVASIGEDKSEAAITNAVLFGSAIKLAPDYTADFASEDNATLWSQYDANGDGNVWEYKSGSWKYDSFTTPGDWLITPPFTTEYTKASGHFTAECYASRYPETIEVAVLSAPDGSVVENLGTFTIESSLGTTCDIPEFTVPTGLKQWYLGFHLVTEDCWGCTFTAFDITASGEPTGIGAVRNAANGVGFSGGAISLGSKSADVEIISASGALARSLRAVSSVSLDGLAKGVYVVVVKENGKVTNRLKVSK